MYRCAILCLTMPLLAQDYRITDVVRIAGRLRHADGPAAPFSGEFLLFTDAPANKILRFVPNHGVDTFRENSGGASGLAFDEKGRLYVCEPAGRRVVRLDTKGAVEVLAADFEGKPLNGPNDLAVRRDGHLWFTDPAFGSQRERQQQPAQGVYHLTPRRELTPVWRGATRPGGVALSPNGRTLYVSDADARLVRVWDLDRSGQASNERVLISKIPGVPMGLRTDEKGALFVAADGVQIYSPEGKLLHQWKMAGPVSNLAFGDPDFQSLYIAAKDGIFRARMPVRGAQP